MATTPDGATFRLRRVGPVSLVAMRPRSARPGFVYLGCPKCGEPLHKPYPDTSGPLADVHTSCGARLVLIPSASPPQIREVPRSQSLEAAIIAARAEGGDA